MVLIDRIKENNVESLKCIENLKQNISVQSLFEGREENE